MGLKIASVTLAGNNADIIGDALRSAVDEVDVCVLIDTRTLALDGTLEVAEMVCGSKLKVIRKPWRDDFGYMRTAAMELTARYAQWGVWLDSDERWVCQKPGAVRELCETAGDLADAITIWHVSGEYRKERCIHLPLAGKYHGRTHEYLKLDDPKRLAISQGAFRFDELPKTPEQMTAKLQRDIAALALMAGEEPEEPRWRYYLGDAHYVLGTHQSDADEAHRMKEVALHHFMQAAQAGAGWGELRSWAAFRAANIFMEAGEPRMAREVAGLGLSDRITPELLWILAAGALTEGDYPEAIKAATHCVAAGTFSGYGQTLQAQESGHVYPPSRYEAPYDILARAYRAMGHEQAAGHAAGQYVKAQALREAA